MVDIKGFEGEYAVTSCGKVWSYKSQKFLKTRLDKDGYERITLYISDRKTKTIFIHQLVAQAYIPNPTGLPQVNHKDEVKLHNWVGNLEWCDQLYNNNYGTRSERAAMSKRIAVYCVELDKTFPSMKEAAEYVGLATTDGISGCCKGVRKTSGGYHWKFAETASCE